MIRFLPLWLVCLALFACSSVQRVKGGGAGSKLQRGFWHHVSRGDTLSSISRLHDVELVDIEEINGRDRHDPLVVGSLIFIPGVRAGLRPRSGYGRGADGNHSKSLLIWPVPGGKLVSGFGQGKRRFHLGLDIVAPAGTAILAAGKGEVIYSGSTIKDYGNMVVLRHSSVLSTVYAYNRRNLVSRGDRVTRGQKIAEVGKTGRATGYHLHFEVRIGSRAVDPIGYLISTE